MRASGYLAVDQTSSGSAKGGLPSFLTRREPPESGLKQMMHSRLMASPFLSEQERSALEKDFGPAQSYPAHVDLIRQGEQADNILMITKGWACRYVMVPDGGRHWPGLVLPGDLANLDTLHFNPLEYGLQTLTGVTVLPLARHKAAALAGEHIGIARTFAWLAICENAILSAWTVSLGRRSATERLAHLLCELITRLGLPDGHGELECPLTQQDLGNILGLSTVHINRVTQTLRRDRLLANDSRKLRLNVPGLRALSGFDPRYLHHGLEPV